MSLSASFSTAEFNNYEIHQLTPERLALADRFYRSQGYKVKCAPNERVFALIGTAGDWLGAVRLVAQSSGHYWLRNLLVAPEYRNRGLAGQLLMQSRRAIFPKGCYCFALPHLTDFYKRSGFELAPAHCPADIRAIYERYKSRGRDWVLMGYQQG